MDRFTAGTAHPQTIVRVHEWVAWHAERRPDKTALICGAEQLTYATLRRELEAMAVALARSGIRPGDRVLVDTAAPVDALLGYMASMSIGAVAVPYPSADQALCAYILQDSRPGALVSREDVSLPSPGAEVVRIKRCSEGEEAFPEVVAEVVPLDLAMIFYTSGTSGQRKGVMLPYQALQVSIDNRIDMMEITSDLREYLAAPVSHVFGFGRCRLAFQVGGTIVLEEGKINPFRVLGTMARHGCNAIGGPAGIYAMILENLRTRLEELAPGIRWVEIASQRLAEDYKRMLARLMPQARVFMNFGLTEAIFSTVLELKAESSRLGSVGRPAPGVRVCIQDEDGQAVAANSPGEICIGGTSLAMGYWNKDELWRRTYRDGWFHTGDLGYVNADGDLVVIGRRSDVANIGGRMVSPDDVEELLAPFLSGVEYAVFRIDGGDDRCEERLGLCIEGDVSVDLGALRRELASRTEAYMIPTRLFSLAELPRTANGKVKRSRIAELYGQSAS